MNDNFTLHWSEIPPLPPVTGKIRQPGLAGPVAGASGDYLMVAGGANFEDNLPWRGGTKSYHDEIFLFQKNLINNHKWKQADERLPLKMAYPACLSFKEGIISMGGETESGPTIKVYRFTVESGHVKTYSLPDLPVGLSASSTASFGNLIYLAGGTDQSGAVNLFLSLDLDDLSSGWRPLTPLPVALSHSVAAFLNDGNENCFFLFGGRNKNTEVHTFFSDIWKYSPSKKVWTRESDILSDGKPLALAAGYGIAAGKDRLLLFGGDPGIFFNLTERFNIAIANAGDAAIREQLLQEKDSLLSHHPGFSRDILLYNTLTGDWLKAGMIPSFSPVTTVAFSWNGRIIIPSGEIRPGVRTPDVLAVEIK